MPVKINYLQVQKDFNICTRRYRLIFIFWTKFSSMALYIKRQLIWYSFFHKYYIIFCSNLLNLFYKSKKNIPMKMQN